jgi:hypothetical protein
MSRWVHNQLVLFGPFFVSAAFYLSAFLAVFAPFPLMYVYINRGRALACLAALSNSILVFILGGRHSLAIYALFVAGLSLVFSELLIRLKSFEKSIFFSLVALAVVLAGGLAVYAQVKHDSLLPVFERQLSLFVDELTKSLSNSSELLNPADVDPAEWKQWDAPFAVKPKRYSRSDWAGSRIF